MFRKKSKGFTLIEMLAVVVILIVIIAIAVPIVSNVIASSRLSAYYANEKQLIKLSKVYLVSNSNLYPVDGQAIKITLDDLKNAGLISTLPDPNAPNQQCDAYVEITKVLDSYKYNSYIDCGDNYTTIGFTGLQLPIVASVGNGSSDYFRGVTALANGYIAVGESNSTNKDLVDLNKGVNDATIVKYDIDGNVIWKKNYGGNNLDCFYDVVGVSDGYVAVGNSISTDSDVTGLNKGAQDAVIVKYNLNGDIVWKKNYGGTSTDYFRNIATVSDGFIVVGYSGSSNGDITGLSKGGTDIIVVKYDSNGNVVWKKNYGGTSTDYGYNITTTSDAIIIVGGSRSTNGDFTGLNKGDYDAFIYKLDLNGNIVWNKNYGGSLPDHFYGTLALSDGYIAVGYSSSTTVDLVGLNKGDYDAIIVKYDLNGNVVWKQNYGGTAPDYFYDIALASDGNIVASGRSSSTTVDLSGLNKGDYDSILVEYDVLGNVIWKKNYGGSGSDSFEAMATASNGIIVVGYTTSTNLDISGLNRGDYDAIVVKYDLSGTVTWKQNYGGGPGTDYFENAAYFDNHYFTIGYGSSITGDFDSLNKGGTDAIIFKYDLSGKKIWQKNYGGTGTDHFYNIIAVADGLIVVGDSSSTNVDLSGLNKGSADAIIVKYDSNGNVVWKKNYGGTGSDIFYDVVESNDSYIAVGTSTSNTDDLSGLNKGGNDAVIVSFDKDGNILWTKDCGGTGTDQFRGIVLNANEYVVTGYSNSTGGDFTGLNKGSYDGIVVKYDISGNVIWKKNYGGSSSDYFYSITSSSSNVYVAGISSSSDLDVAGISKGGTDSIIVSYDKDGTISWKQNVGGSSNDYIYRIVNANNYLYAAGRSNSTTDIFTGLNRGSYDAFLAKYDLAGNFVENTVYGGSSDDSFSGLSPVRDGIIMVGYSSSVNNEFTGLGSGYVDAIVIGYK